MKKIIFIFVVFLNFSIYPMKDDDKNNDSSHAHQAQSLSRGDNSLGELKRHRRRRSLTDSTAKKIIKKKDLTVPENLVYPRKHPKDTTPTFLHPILYMVGKRPGASAQAQGLQILKFFIEKYDDPYKKECLIEITEYFIRLHKVKCNKYLKESELYFNAEKIPNASTRQIQLLKAQQKTKQALKHLQLEANLRQEKVEKLPEFQETTNQMQQIQKELGSTPNYTIISELQAKAEAKERLAQEQLRAALEAKSESTSYPEAAELSKNNKSTKSGVLTILADKRKNLELLREKKGGS